MPILFQYPLFRIVDCFGATAGFVGGGGFVSISALSDRGLLHARELRSLADTYVSISALSDRGLLLSNLLIAYGAEAGFNIRSFGSWIASRSFHSLMKSVICFNIRSFGSWIASLCRGRSSKLVSSFQYPLFRIVDCFPPPSRHTQNMIIVSISALSDRGLLHYPN